MRAIERTTMHTNKFLPLTMKLIRRYRRVRNAPRVTFTISTFLGLILLLACSFGCAPASSPSDSSSSASSESPELTEETIREQINHTRVRKVTEENGNAEPINWTFDDEEPKEITVIDEKIEGDRATIILDIKTGSAKGAREQRYLDGQIRTDWELQTGWVLRKWEIVKTENISMKYKNLAKPPAQNSER